MSASVVKVGGSLLADPGRLCAVLAGLADGRDGPAVIVPGGGPFADAVRAAQEALGFGDRLAHRLALDAMGRMAEVFRELEPRLCVVRGVEDAAASLASGAAVWEPVRLRSGHADIAETWNVTSDSLALWLATRLQAARCILIKSVPCPVDADPSTLSRAGLVDGASPQFARDFDGEIVIRGPFDERTVQRARETLSSRPLPHPEMRGEAEPRRNAPVGAGHSGALFRGRAAAPRDEGEDGVGRRTHRPGSTDAAA